MVMKVSYKAVVRTTWDQFGEADCSRWRLNLRRSIWCISVREWVCKLLDKKNRWPISIINWRYHENISQTTMKFRSWRQHLKEKKKCLGQSISQKQAFLNLNEIIRNMLSILSGSISAADCFAQLAWRLSLCLCLKLLHGFRELSNTWGISCSAARRLEVDRLYSLRIVHVLATDWLQNTAESFWEVNISRAEFV